MTSDIPESLVTLDAIAMKLSSLTAFFLSLTLLMPGVSCASITINGTRIIYSESAHEQTIRLDNNDSSPVLIQAWIDEFDGTRPARDAVSPYLVMPTIFRLDPGKGQSLRIRKIRPLPSAEQESLHWLNIKEVPPAPDPNNGENYLQFGILSRLKVIYRPESLDSGAADAATRLRWYRGSLDGRPSILCDNPTAYYVSLAELRWQVAGKTHRMSLDTVAPHSQQQWGIPDDLGPLPGPFTFASVNDYGALVTLNAELTPR